MAVKDVGSGATAGKAWRREWGRRNRQDGSRYNRLSSCHWLAEGREGWSSLGDSLGSLVATLTPVCSGSSSSILTARTTALRAESITNMTFLCVFRAVIIDSDCTDNSSRSGIHHEYDVFGTNVRKHLTNIPALSIRALFDTVKRFCAKCEPRAMYGSLLEPQQYSTARD